MILLRLPTFLLTAVAAISICSGLASQCWGQEAPKQQRDAGAAVSALQESLVKLIAKAEPSVVAISRAPGIDTAQMTPLALSSFTPLSGTFGSRGRDAFTPSGAGVVIDAKGLVLTQYLNVRNGDQHLITTTDGRQLAATIKAADPRSGLAILEVQAANLVALEIGDADLLRKGYFVITVGNPQAIIASGEPSASWGTITNLAQRAAPTMNLNNTLDETGAGYSTSLHHLGTLLQTDAKLNWASAGAAVIDLSGKLIGISTSAGTLPGHESPAGYAIPMTSTFRRVVDDLKAGKEVEYGLLGLTLDGPDRRSNRTADSVPGAVVSRTVRGSAADRAGIRIDDRLIQVDGKPVNSVADLQLLVGSLPPGKPVSVGLIRGGQKMDLPVSLSKLYVRGEKVVTSARRSWRGIQVDYSTAIALDEIDRASSLSRIDPKGCVLVSKVAEESPAAQAGIESGMFISHVGDRRISTPNEFFDAVAGTEETVHLRFTDSDAATNNRESHEREVESSTSP